MESAPRGPRLTGIMWGALTIGAVVTAVAALEPLVRFAYENPPVHVMLETAEASVAFLAAFLIAGRFRQRRSPADLLLCLALGILGLTNILFTLGPIVVTGDLEPFVDWFPLAIRTVGALLVATAALAPLRPVTAPTRAVRLAVGVAAAVVAAVGLLLLGSVDRLPSATVEGVTAAEAGRPLIRGHAVLFVAQYIAMAAFAVAAWGFARRAQRMQDDMLGWFAAGCVLAAFARINYSLFPSMYTDFVYLGDFLRFGFYAFVAIGASREIRAYWRQRAEAAVLEERSRLASELHDGLAQELVFIAAQTKRLQRGREGDPEGGMRRLSSASDRAVAEARRAISALTRPMGQPLDDALEELVEEVAPGRRDLFELRLQESVVIDPLVQEEFLRIVREALTNALEHSGARSVIVSLVVQDGDLRVEVRDDGSGFDVHDAGRDGGFGLVSMRERAKGIGANWEVSSRPGEGTTVKVMLPSKT